MDNISSWQGPSSVNHKLTCKKVSWIRSLPDLGGGGGLHHKAGCCKADTGGREVPWGDGVASVDSVSCGDGGLDLCWSLASGGDGQAKSRQFSATTDLGPLWTLDLFLCVVRAELPDPLPSFPCTSPWLFPLNRGSRVREGRGTVVPLALVLGSSSKTLRF